MGDTADNIPGVPKVGEKTATDLMVRFGSLEGIYEHIEEVTKKAVKESLLCNRELADLSRTLAAIRTDSHCFIRLFFMCYLLFLLCIIPIKWFSESENTVEF